MQGCYTAKEKQEHFKVKNGIQAHLKPPSDSYSLTSNAPSTNKYI